MTHVEIDEYRCDRCGHVEQRPGRKANGERAGKPEGRGRADLTPIFPSGGDLCPTCLSELCKWWEMQP
jgi:hypothetical protein